MTRGMEARHTHWASAACRRVTAGSTVYMAVVCASCRMVWRRDMPSLGVAEVRLLRRLLVHRGPLTQREGLATQ